DMAKFAKDRQYELESFSIDERFTAEAFPVKQGDLIGYIGQRGYVSGPHLHFEIRDTESERLLNPMNFGITVADSRRPSVRKLRLYQLDERGRVLLGEDFSIQNSGRGTYETIADTLFIDHPSFAVGIKAYDQQDGRPNLNGIYQLELRQDDSLSFAYQMDHFAGNQTRYLNAHLDYEEQQKNNSWFQRAFRMPGNQLDFYQADQRQGRFTLEAGQASSLQFTIGDHRRNRTKLNLIVKRSETPPPSQQATYNYYLPHDEESLIDDGLIRAHFSEGTLYEDLYLNCERIKEKSDDVYSAVYRLQSSTTPLHRYFDLHLPPAGLPDHLKDKAIIAYCNDGEEPISYGGEWTAAGRLRAPVRSFGNFSIMVDTTPPEVTEERFGTDMRGWDQFSFKLSDNFPTSGKARSLRFRAEVDGEWILMEYNGRKKRLYHVFDEHIPPGEHQLVLLVVDDRGNETVVEKSFRR
ncbi:MAG: M23 family metallopeptidase, partial [Bacteroidota bacterium]